MLPALAAINALNSLLFALFVAGSVAFLNIVVWWLPIWVIAALQLWKGRQLLALPAPERVSGRFLRRANHLSLLIGIAWGSGIFWLWSDDVVLNAFLMVLMAGMCAGVSATLSSAVFAASRFVLGCGTLIIAGIVSFQPPHWEPMLALCLILFGSLFYGGLVSHRNLVAEIGSRLEVEASRSLMREMIDASADAIALFGKDGTELLSNKAHRAWFDEVALSKLALEDHAKQGRIRFSQQTFFQTRTETQGGLVVLAHRDDTELLAMRDSIATQADELEYAERTMDRFLDNVRSELRDPIVSIKQYVAMMRPVPGRPIDEDSTTRLSGLIGSCASRVLSMLDDLLLATRASDQSQFIVDSCSLEDTLSQLTADPSWRTGSSWTGNFVLDQPDGRVALYVDHKVLYRLMEVLMTFVAEYYRGDENRSITIDRCGDRLVLRLDDDCSYSSGRAAVQGGPVAAFDARERALSWSVALSLSRSLRCELAYVEGEDGAGCVEVSFAAEHGRVVANKDNWTAAASNV